MHPIHQPNETNSIQPDLQIGFSCIGGLEYYFELRVSIHRIQLNTPYIYIYIIFFINLILFFFSLIYFGLLRIIHDEFENLEYNLGILC